MNIMFLKQIEVFMEKIVHYGYLLYVKIFINKFPLKLLFFSLFVML
jgi:hypothetical protein